MNSEWHAIESKLKQEAKAALIQLIQELAAVSPEVQRYLQTRYLKKKTTTEKIAPYCKVIQDQFVISDWNNAVTWDFSGVEKAIDNYAKSSQGDEAGLCELLVAALETAVNFADSINLQVDDFDAGLTDLADRCASHLQSHPDLYPSYRRRLKTVQRKGGDLGYYAMVESLDAL